MDDVPYDRKVLVDVLVYHWPRQDSSCFCGWGQRPEHLGLSHAEHVATVYEESVRARA
jgi:hypothetical protein